MEVILLSVVIGIFVAMLFLNIYFRVKVFKVYKVLSKNRVEFGAKHLFSKKAMEEEIYPQYPQWRTEIDTFTRHIKYSIRMATVLTTLISAFAAILMYYR